MNAIMIYYLYANAPAGLGFDKADAAQLISLYATVVGMTTIIGSYVCDRILGCRRSLLVARVTGFIGYTLLAFPLGVVGYAAAMGCMVFGSLFAGRCIETLIGKFYDENDGRRDSAFTISYVISNIGAAAPALAGVIAAKCGYHAAFALSAVLSFLGTVAYIATYKKFFGNIGLEPDDPLPADKKRSFVVKMLIVVAIVGTVLAVSFATGKLKISSFANVVSTISIFIPLAYLVFIYSSKKTEKHEKKKVLCLLPPFICNAVTLLIWTQTISILAIFYEEKVNRVIFGVEIPAASFQTIPAIFAVCFGSLLTMLWTKLGKKQPFGTTKMGFGTILWGLGAMIIALLYIIYPGDAKVNAWWIVLFYAVLMFAEGFTCPIGYSITAVALFLLAWYSITTTLFAAILSPVFLNDFITFFGAIGKGTRSLFREFVTGADSFGQLSSGIPNSILSGIMYWLIASVVMGILFVITGLLIIGIGYQIGKIYRKYCWDIISIMVAIMSTAIAIYFGDWIKSIISINLITLLLLVHVVYIGIRCYVKDWMEERGYY